MNIYFKNDYNNDYYNDYNNYYYNDYSNDYYNDCYNDYYNDYNNDYYNRGDAVSGVCKCNWKRRSFRMRCVFYILIP